MGATLGANGWVVDPIEDEEEAIAEAAQLLHAGERNVDSASNSYLATKEECNYTVVDLATDSDVVVSAAPAFLLGVYVNTVFSANEVTLLDGAVTAVVLPASLAAGTNHRFPAIRFETSLVVNSDNAATGSLVVLWRPI